MEEVNKNFSNIAKLAEKNGSVTILKDGKQKFLLIDVDSYFEITNEKNYVAAKRIMRNFKPAFEELGKK